MADGGWPLVSRIAPAKRSDPTLDYCLWPYEPPALPTPDSWQASALLFHSLHEAGVSNRALTLCDAIRAAAGPFHTVVGIKYAEGRLSWEFYFYDYDRLGRHFDTRALCRALAPHVDIAVPLTGDGVPYFMFSVELTPDHFEGRAALSQIDLYIGNPGSTVSSGICYGLTASGMEMRNFYFFFDAKTQRAEIEGKLLSTANAPSPPDPASLLWSEVDPQVIVIANKRRADSVYFSRIGVDDLCYCLNRLQVPGPLAGFASDNRARFRHLLFDVGYDWEWSGDGIRTTKASWYVIL